MDKIKNTKKGAVPKVKSAASKPSVASPAPKPELSNFAGWKSLQNEFFFVKDPQTAKALNTANRFAQEPKVDITVFPSIDEPDQKVYWGGINGFFFAVVVGVKARVPQSIADHVHASRIANQRAGKGLMVINPFTGQRVNVDLKNAADETKRRLGLI